MNMVNMKKIDFDITLKGDRKDIDVKIEE